MITCIVNPSRCGSTWLQHIIDKHYLLEDLNDYSMEYEVIDHANGVKLIDNPPTKNFLFKYQYLYANRPLLGADKYIVLDRRDLDAWVYSSYMAFQNHHPHGALDEYKEYIYDEKVFQVHKKQMMKLRKESWEPEKARLISQGAINLVYEDIKDLSTKDILSECGIDKGWDFDKNDLWFRNQVKLAPVWSCKQK
tara:strand:+ start:1751 stop:2332 length:582 start_codon:yes stop_codon:yes gene_type:complete